MSEKVKNILKFNKSTRFRLSVYSCIFLASFAIICVLYDFENLATRCIEGFMLIGTSYLFGRSYTDVKCKDYDSRTEK